MTTKTIFENISNRFLQAGKSVTKRVLVFAAGLPAMILMAVRRLLTPIFNIYVLFWCLKHLQKKLLDPLLDVSIGMSTLDGWKSERALRYTTGQLTASKMNQIVKNNEGTRNTENSSSELSFEKSAQLITIWWQLTTKKDDESTDIRSKVIYTHMKFLHPSLVLSSNKITLQGISNGQVIFNVSDDLVEDLYEVIEAEDAELEKGKLQSVIQRIGMVLFWLPNKALNRYWARKHVIILPSWAFNKLILVSNPSLNQILQTGPTQCLSPTKTRKMNRDNFHHSPNRDETIVAYFDAIGEGLASVQKGLIWQWNTLKSSANIYIKANQQAYRIASRSTKGVSSLGRILSTYVLANV